MIWALRPGSGCRRLECMILPLATCVYLISVPAALQPFTVVLTHQHSDCNRMLVLRGPCMPSCLPLRLGSYPWLLLPALFLRARPLGRRWARCRGGWKWILDLAEACKGPRTGVWVGGKSVFLARWPTGQLQWLRALCTDPLPSAQRPTSPPVSLHLTSFTAGS